MSGTTASVSSETLKRLKLYRDVTDRDSLDETISDGLDALGAPAVEELEALVEESTADGAR